MSRLQNARTAVRPALKARAMLSGPPGSGKTRSALIVAEVLVSTPGAILMIDTEKESALTYADDFTFDHLPWDPPFNPRDLATTVVEAGRSYEVVVVDSASHFWRGDGGTLDIAGGKFTGWKDARPAQSDLVDAFLGCGAHLIICSRSKVEHVQELNPKTGKHEVKKLGMAVIQDDDLEYELNVALELDMDQSMTVSKSRTVAVPVGRNFKAGHAEDFAVAYRDWLAGGEPAADEATIVRLVARLNALPPELRKAAKQEFVAAFGKPEHLRETQVGDASDLVARHEADVVLDPSPSDGVEGGPSDDVPAASSDGSAEDPGFFERDDAEVPA
jgi:energy-coupling factor transporter ATP-binding protein EcfA2